MRTARTDLAFGVMENLPSILFVGLWKAGLGLETAGWTGCGTALLVLLLFSYLQRKPDTILLGININFVFTTPLIVGLFVGGQAEWARWCVTYAGTGAIATVFATGLVLTAVSGRGFVGAEDLPRPIQRRFSALLLVLTAGAVVWSAFQVGDHWLAIVLPLVVIFATRRFVLAHLSDRGGHDVSPTLAVAAVPTPE